MKLALLTLGAAAATTNTTCTNTADAGIWAAKGKAAFDADMNTCGKKCMGAAPCVTKCIVATEGYTADCAACFGDLGGCTAKHCWSQCLGGESAKCTACTQTNCVPGFSSCSGIPASDLKPAVARGAATNTTSAPLGRSCLSSGSSCKQFRTGCCPGLTCLTSTYTCQ